MMVQMDGSHHDWLEEPGATVSVSWEVVDDATNTVAARFYDHEGTVPALESFRRWVQRYGIPAIVYLDKHTSLYRSPQGPSLEENITGFRTLAKVSSNGP